MPSLPASANYLYIAMVRTKYRVIITTINITIQTPVHFAVSSSRYRIISARSLEKLRISPGTMPSLPASKNYYIAMVTIKNRVLIIRINTTITTPVHSAMSSSRYRTIVRSRWRHFLNHLGPCRACLQVKIIYI